jgi:NAD-dependent deacetylase
MYCNVRAEPWLAERMDQHQQKTLEAIVRVLRKCESILFVTGAGISADSGVPTYRGIGGLYEIDSTEEGLPIEVILSGSTFQSDPELTWKYLGQIAAAARHARYNRAHQVIAEMEQHFSRVWTLTQNVDGFHRMAGSENVIEIHGNMRSLSCTRCEHHKFVRPEEDVEMPPVCPACHAMMRPDVVLFEEMLPEEATRRLRRELETGFDAAISIGTSALFPYIQEPFVIARQRGIPTVEINPGETPLSHQVDYRLVMRAAEAMDIIWKRLQDSD